MNKRLLIALIIIGLTVIVLVFNTIGSDRMISVDIIVKTIDAYKSLAFLAFVAVGVVIGALLK